MVRQHPPDHQNLAECEDREGPAEEQLEPPVIPVQPVVACNLAEDDKAMHRDEERRQQRVMQHAQGAEAEQGVARNDQARGELQHGLERKDSDHDQREPRHGAECCQHVAMRGQGGGGERMLSADQGLPPGRAVLSGYR